VWRGVGLHDVFRPILPSGLWSVGRWVGQRLHLPVPRLEGLLDTGPLVETAHRVVPWDRMRENLDSGAVSTLAVVATSTRSGRTVVFVDQPTAREALTPDDSRPLDYVRTPIVAEHVLASAAIPVAFPPVYVSTAGVEGWYADGGIRLNAPLKPSVTLGADGLVVVATHPCEYPPVPPRGHHQHRLPPPGVDDTVVQLMDAALVDPMVEDLRTLRKVNELVAGGAQRSASKRPLKVLPNLFFGPTRRGTLAEVALETFETRFGGADGALRRVFDPDLPLLAALFVGNGPRRGDLLSYLMFDPAFVDRASELGRRDAERVLRARSLPWERGLTEPDRSRVMTRPVGRRSRTIRPV
jgi:NTE family protein